MTRFLSLIGLMRRSEHEAFVQTSGRALANSERDLKEARAARTNAETSRDGWANYADDMEAKFKKAVIDLEKQAGEIADWRTALERMEGDRDNWRAQALRDGTDAEAMRAKRARDRDQKAARRKERVQP